MTKADIVERIAEKTGFTKKESADLMDLVLTTLKDTLEAGEKIKIAGFGNFVVKTKAPRRGRNPQTAETITITGRKILSFKPSSIMKANINAAQPVEGNN